MKKQLLLASMLALAPLPALASAFYVSVDAGQSKLAIEDWDDTSGAYTLGIGFRFNRVLSLEIAARDLGSFGESFSGEYEDVDGSWKEKYELSYLSLQHSLLINIPIGNAGIYGRIGMAHLFEDYEESYEDTYYDEADSYSESDNKTVALGGIGFKADVTSSLTLRSEYSIYSKWDERELSNISVGMTYRF